MATTYCPPISHYRHFQVPPSWTPVMARIIGQKGRHFIRITEQTKVDYIWYDKATGRVEIWGPETKVVNAEHVLRNWGNRVCS